MAVDIGLEQQPACRARRTPLIWLATALVLVAALAALGWMDSAAWATTPTHGAAEAGAALVSAPAVTEASPAFGTDARSSAPCAAGIAGDVVSEGSPHEVLAAYLAVCHQP